MAVEELAKVIKDCQTKNNELTDLIYGVVTNTSPLTVRVDNRFNIQRQHLILSQMVRNLTVNGSIQIFRDLQTGDRVRMLRVSKGQKYYVLERGD